MGVSCRDSALLVGEANAGLAGRPAFMETRKLKMHRCVTVCMGSDCKDNGAKKIYKQLEKSLKEQKLKGRVRLTTCKCTGDCDKGPHVMSYPQGPWYYDVSRGDVDAIVAGLVKKAEAAPEE